MSNVPIQKPRVQHSASRVTPPSVANKANLPNDPCPATHTEAVLSAHFGCPVRLYDPAEIDWPAEEPGECLGTLADSDTDDYWHPPPSTPLYYGDEGGRPCDPGQARWWTYRGATSWFDVEIYPPPNGVRKNE
jgi:hypothetical protein